MTSQLGISVDLVKEGYVFFDEEGGYCMTPEVLAMWLGLVTWATVNMPTEVKDCVYRGFPGMCEN